jgi:hypothetical protein
MTKPGKQAISVSLNNHPLFKFNKIYKSNQFIKLKIALYKNRSLPESFFLQSFLKSDKEMAVR